MILQTTQWYWVSCQPRCLFPILKSEPTNSRHNTKTDWENMNVSPGHPSDSNEMGLFRHLYYKLRITDHLLKWRTIENSFALLSVRRDVPNCSKVIGKVSELWGALIHKHHGQFGVHWAFIRLNKFHSDFCYRNWQQISNPQKCIIYVFDMLHCITFCHTASCQWLI